MFCSDPKFKSGLFLWPFFWVDQPGPGGNDEEERDFILGDGSFW